MGKWIVSVLIASQCAVAMAGDRHHVIIDGGTVHIRGSLVAPACTVAIESHTQTVEMGQIRSNLFKGAGSDALPVPFFLHLRDCNTVASQNVGITFWGQSDQKDPQILQITSRMNAAQGVGIALFTAHGELILLNTLVSTDYALHDGDNRLQFVAKYRATASQVTGGVAEATTWFALTYP